MKVNVGFSRSKDASANALEIAAEIKKDAMPLNGNDLLLAFCNEGIEKTAFFTELRDAFSKIPVFGGGVVGVITNTQLEYQTPVAGAMLIQGDNYTFRYGSVDNFFQNEVESGEKLIKTLSVKQEDKALIIFFETTAIEAAEENPLVLNKSTLLCDGIYKQMPETIMLTGAGLAENFNFGKTRQFCGDIIRRDSAMGLMFGGPIKTFCKIFHGCTPLDGIYHTITKITDGIIEELDGKSIVRMMDELYQDQGWRKEQPIKFLTLGVNKGDKFCDFSEDNYVNRLIAGISPDEKGIIPIESFFQEGDEIQFMLRDNNNMIKTARERTQALIDRISSENIKPRLALYIDCAGRSANFCHSATEEAEEVQKILNKNNIPLLGIYSGVEIAPVKNRSLGLGWTGILFILAEE